MGRDAYKCEHFDLVAKENQLLRKNRNRRERRETLC